MDQTLLEKVLKGEAIETTKAQGTGIGMLTVNSMLNRIGGNLTGFSEIGKGTTWTIEIPSIEEIEIIEEITERPDTREIIIEN